MLLDLDESRWRAVGAEYHSDRWSFVATDLKGTILRSITRPAKDSGPRGFLEALIEGLREIRHDLGGRLLPAYGIGVPGLADPGRGVIVRADDLGWKDVRVGEAVQAALGARALLVNRNRAGGLAESRFGAGRGLRSMIYIGIGTGISAALLLDGVLVDGPSFSAGEIGHTIMDVRGPRCGCGRRGCLQVFASGPAMVRKAAAALEAGRPSSLRAFRSEGAHLTGEAICEAAAAGDGLALECLTEAARYLGLCVANILTTYNPDKIVIGGPLGLLDGPLVDIVRAEAEAWAVPDAFKAASIERGRIGESVGALGAACRVLDEKLALAASSGP